MWSGLIICMEVCELINQKAEWLRKWENFIQTLHLVLVLVYLIVVGLGLSHCLHLMPLMAALVVCLAWLDVSLSMSYLLFGKWSSLGLYITMLLEVNDPW